MRTHMDVASLARNKKNTQKKRSDTKSVSFFLTSSSPRLDKDLLHNESGIMRALCRQYQLKRVLSFNLGKETATS